MLYIGNHKKLKPKQLACIKLMLTGELTQKQIADELKVSENTITNWKKTEQFNEQYIAGLKSGMKEAAAEAFAVEKKLLKSGFDAVRLAAAKDILDRAGFKPEESMKLSSDGESLGQLASILGQLKDG